jgi:hypothetical protein
MARLPFPFDVAAYRLARGLDGDHEAMRETLGEIARQLRQDTLNPTYRLWLAEALESIATGATDPARALYLNHGRGGRRGSLDREIEIAQEVHWHPGGKHKEPGGAYFEVGQQYSRSASAVERIYQKWREGLEANDADARELMERDRVSTSVTTEKDTDTR